MKTLLCVPCELPVFREAAGQSSLHTVSISRWSAEAHLAWEPLTKGSSKTLPGRVKFHDPGWFLCSEQSICSAKTVWILILAMFLISLHAPTLDCLMDWLHASIWLCFFLGLDISLAHSNISLSTIVLPISEALLPVLPHASVLVSRNHSSKFSKGCHTLVRKDSNVDFKVQLSLICSSHKPRIGRTPVQTEVLSHTYVKRANTLFFFKKNEYTFFFLKKRICK